MEKELTIRGYSFKWFTRDELKEELPRWEAFARMYGDEVEGAFVHFCNDGYADSDVLCTVAESGGKWRFCAFDRLWGDGEVYDWADGETPEEAFVSFCVARFDYLR